MTVIAKTDARYVDIGQSRLEYQWFADSAAAETIVLLHEGLGSVSMWKDFPERLAFSTGRQVLAYSRHGYGRSARLETKREPDYMHHEGRVVLPALLDALGVCSPTLLGHSDGASIALIFAGLYPDRPARLILEAPHVFVEPVTTESIARAREVYETTDLSRKLGRYHDDVDSTFWGWNDIWLDPRFLAWNIEDMLPPVKCPVLMIQGRQDEYGTLAQLDTIASKVGTSHTVLIDECGHSPHRDQPEQTLDAINRFLGTGAPE